MLRIMSFVTLVVIAICLLVGAGIALADDTVTAGQNAVVGMDAVIDASRPQADNFEPNLAAADDEDVYEFDGYDADVKRPTPIVEPTEIREC